MYLANQSVETHASPARYLLEHSVCPIFALVRRSRQKDGAAEQVRHGDLRCRGVYCMMAGVRGENQRNGGRSCGGFLDPRSNTLKIQAYARILQKI